MSSDLPVFLLGAGASADAGLPMSRDLTSLTLQRMAARDVPADLRHALNFVVASVVAYDVRLGLGSATDQPDIERVASAIELLAQRADLEVAPFVDQWDAALASFETKTPRLPPTFESQVHKALTGRSRGTAAPALGPAMDKYFAALIKKRSTASAEKEIEKALPQLNARDLTKLLVRLVTTYQSAGTQDLFGILLSLVIAGLREHLMTPDQEGFDYLAPLLKVTRADGRPLTIATLNYDLGVETSALHAQVPLTRGVEEWSQTGRLTFATDATRLLKLHGSLDWIRAASPDRLAGAELRVDPNNEGTPFLVFGQREKLRAEGPFLQLLEEFRRTLFGSRTLVAVGYAFRDPHINEVIGRWIRGDASRRLVVVDPMFDPTSHHTRASVDFRGPLLQPSLQGRVAWQRQTAAEFAATLGGISNFDHLF